MAIPAPRAPLACVLLLAFAAVAVVGQFDSFAGPNRCTCHCCAAENDEQCSTAVMDAPNRGACNPSECADAFEECEEAKFVDAFFHDCECSCLHEGVLFKQSVPVSSANECNKETCAFQVPSYCEDPSNITPTFLDCDCGCCEEDCEEPYVHTVGAGRKDKCNPELCRDLLFQCPAPGEGAVEAMFLTFDASGPRDEREDPIPSLMPGVSDSSRSIDVVVPDCVCTCDGGEFTIFTGSASTCTELICSAVLAPCAKKGIDISARHEMGGMPAGFSQMFSQQVSGLQVWEVVLLTLGIVLFVVLIVLGIVCIVRTVRSKKYQSFEKDMANVSLPSSMVTHEVDDKMTTLEMT